VSRALPLPASQHAHPLNITGNVTQIQNESLRAVLAEAVLAAHESAVQRLDRHSAQLVLDGEKKFRAEVAKSLEALIERFTISDKFKDEQTQSRHDYPPTYRPRPIEAQVTELRKIFPTLGHCMEKLARKPLAEGGEAWFAAPHWQVLAPTYGQACEMMLEALGVRRKFSNRIVGCLGPGYLRQTERSQQAEKILAEQQEGNDIMVFAAQMGNHHRGLSPRRARVMQAGNEFALGLFTMGCILLVHPERLSLHGSLMIDCTGDEYSIRGDSTFDRVPLFDYGLSGIELSVFYEDRARNLWGTASGFLVQMT
jgi:hypothetical protein